MKTSRWVELSAHQDSWDALMQVAQLPESVVQKFQVTNSVAGTVPTNYEPRYAYPLIVWLCDADCTQDQALDHIAAMSPQNYLGLTLDNIRPATSENGLERAVEFFQQLVDVENKIVTAVRRFRELVNVHTERIFLAGYGSAAESALTILAHQPDWFAGCLSFSGRYPKINELIGKRSLRGKRILLSARSGRDFWQAEQETQHAARMLIAGGASVTTKYHSSMAARFGDSIDETVSDHELRDVDQWIIANLFEPQH